jgi:hypothetical protein
MNFLRFAHGDTIDMLRDSVRDFVASEIARQWQARASHYRRRRQVPLQYWGKSGVTTAPDGDIEALDDRIRPARRCGAVRPDHPDRLRWHPLCNRYVTDRVLTRRTGRQTIHRIGEPNAVPDHEARDGQRGRS